MTRRGGLTAALTLAVLAAGQAVSVGASRNVVDNGSFETPKVGAGFNNYGKGASVGSGSPWIVGSGNVDHVGGRFDAAQGTASIDLNGLTAGSIYQDLSTVPGAVYRLRFAMAGNTEGGAQVMTVAIRWGGSQVATRSFNTQGHTPRSMGWSYRNYTVRATSSKTRLEFASLAPPSGQFGPAIDDVTVTGEAGEPPPPVAGKSVVADVVSGVVFIGVPRGKSIRRGKKSVVATTSKFRRYKGKANIPVGSLIDTRTGRIALTSAADLKGGTASADFYDGIFQIKQQRAARPVTDAELVTSRAKCGKGAAHASASKRLGRLWATGKGRFRTKGRYSSASVRGTTWLTEDRCDGTFTKVSRGRVSVRDNVKRKTIILTAGQSYFARAQRASTK